MLATGKLSYAWYLWHWPLLAVARAADLDTRNVARDLLLVTLAYGLAYISTRYLEIPIRQKRFAPFASPSGSLLSGLALILTMAMTPFVLWIPAYSKYYKTYARLWWPSVSCLSSYDVGQAHPSPPCILSKGNVGSVFLIGDSHASHLAPAVAEWAAKARIDAIERSIVGCDILIVPGANEGPVTGSSWSYPPSCKEFSDLILEEIGNSLANGKPVGIILSINWLLPRYGNPDLLLTKLGVGLEVLNRLGTRTLIIGPSPVFPFSVPKCVGYRNDNACRLPRKEYDTATGAITDGLALLVKNFSDVRIWYPTSQFCDSSWCYPTDNGTLLFSDNEHISPYAAIRAKPDLEPDFNWLIKRP
jgi:hypothetical protein